MHKISNQYAAMPSLHFGWSAWCALVLISTLPRTWMKMIAALYPFATTFSIVVTANHYWLDAVGGAIALSIGYGLGVAITNALARRRRVLRPVEP
jgi:membrane-associated phospholipid phosphatase